MAVGKLTKIYPSTVKFTSSTFKLEDDLIRIQLVGMQEGDCVCVETVVGTSDCDEKFVPYAPDCCGELCYGYPQGQFFLNVPGRYRLVLSNRLDNHLTDPSWFENVEIYQTPVDGTNINLSEGCGSMACAQKITCDPLGIRIDGVLCETPIGKQITTITESGSGWLMIFDDGTSIAIPLSSPDGSIIVNGGKIEIDQSKIVLTPAQVCTAISTMNQTTALLGG